MAIYDRPCRSSPRPSRRNEPSQTALTLRIWPPKITTWARKKGRRIALLPRQRPDEHAPLREGGNVRFDLIAVEHRLIHALLGTVVPELLQPLRRLPSVHLIPASQGSIRRKNILCVEGELVTVLLTTGRV
jgi:hypothetical protein